jgi:hypothetical protein
VCHAAGRLESPADNAEMREFVAQSVSLSNFAAVADVTITRLEAGIRATKKSCLAQSGYLL